VTKFGQGTNNGPRGVNKQWQRWPWSECSTASTKHLPDRPRSTAPPASPEEETQETH